MTSRTPEALDIYSIMQRNGYSNYVKISGGRRMRKGRKLNPGRTVSPGRTSSLLFFGQQTVQFQTNTSQEPGDPNVSL